MMLNQQITEQKSTGGHKRKQDWSNNGKTKTNSPVKPVDHAAKRHRGHKDFEDDRKPFKSFQGRDSWRANADFADSLPEDESSNWYHSVPNDPAEFPPCPPDEVAKLKETAKSMLEAEVTAHQAKASKNSNKAWLQTAMSQGVNRDKVAAMLLALQEDPMYNLNSLRRLISFIKPGNKNCATVIDMLTEVFVKSLLRPNQPCRSFNKRPLALLDELSANNPAGRRRRLIAWYFEDQLKFEYRSFVDAVCQVAVNGVDTTKVKAIAALARLLAANPEHEEVILSSVVNKLGDNDGRVRSKTTQSLTEVIKVHPAMKGVIVDEVERLLFRPNISYKTRLTAVDFLTSLIFQAADSQLAVNLLKIYFSLFKGCVKEGVVDSRLFRSLLRGVKRAYPFAHETMESIAEHMETLHRVVHIAPFSIALHALSLLFMVADCKDSVTDRFYVSLYKKILDPELAVTRDQDDFISLIYRSLQKDQNHLRVRAFIKRLLQVSLYLPVQTTCCLLYTISQVLYRKPVLAPDAVVKLEESAIKPVDGISRMLQDDDDGDEYYEDVGENEDEKPEKKLPVNPAGGWVFRPKQKVDKQEQNCGYDPKHRNPAYAKAEHAFYIELLPLTRHFHPTVVKFATQILEGTTVKYDGNALRDFNMAKFLERFSFKNPKSVPTKSIPHRPLYAAKGAKALSVTSRQYITMHENEIPADEMFMHRYLQSRYSARPEDDNEDLESVTSEDFEQIIRGLVPKGQASDVDEDDEEEEERDGVDYAADVDKTVASQKGKKKAKKIAEDDDGDDLSSDNDGDGSEREESEDDSDLAEFSEDDEDDDNESDISEEEQVKNKEKKRKEVDDEDDEDLDGDDFEDDLGELSGEDEETLEFDDDDDDFDDIEAGASKTKKKKEKDVGDYGPSSSVFASSEKFNELIEKTAAAGRSGGTDDVINRDNSAAKQLKWEQQRDFASQKNWSRKKKFNKGPGGKKAPHNKGGKNFTKKKGGWKK